MVNYHHKTSISPFRSIDPISSANGHEEVAEVMEVSPVAAQKNGHESCGFF